MTERLLKFPFLDYAARHWGSEVGDANYDTLFHAMMDFLSNSVAVEIANQVQSLPQHRFNHWSQEFPKRVPPLVLASCFEIPPLLQHMVQDGHDIEVKGSDGETALIRSASLGHATNITT
jgi:hypothetical protein